MASPDKTVEQLLQLYNEIDAFMRQQYRQDRYAEHGFLIQELAATNHLIARHQQELRTIAQLRNTLVHSPFGAIAQPLARPHPKIVARYKDIRDGLLHPYTVMSIAIPGSQIYRAQLKDKLKSVLQTMNKNTYTHVPIIEKGRLVGVFSENTLLSYLAEIGETIITDDMTMQDFAAHLPLDNHRGESFVFMSRKAPLSEVFEVFGKAIHDHIRIGMLFVTEHGKSDEIPVGILTAWDLASPEFEIL